MRIESFIIINGVIWGIFPFLTLKGANAVENGYRNGSFLKKEDTFMMRGIAAIFIMFAHYINLLQHNSLAEIGPAKILEWFGGLGVCVFFFVSGYGLHKSYCTKAINIGFLVRRVKTIIPTFVGIRLLLGIPVLYVQNKMDIKTFLLYIIGIYKPLWFVSEILLIYLIFFIAHKISRDRIIMITTVSLIIMSIVLCVLGFEARWYNANLVFAFGMFYSKYEIKIRDFFTINYFLKALILGILFIICALIFAKYKGMLWANILKLVSGCLFCLIFICITMKLEWKSSFISYIGQKSLYLYIVHLDIWLIFSNLFSDLHEGRMFLICVLLSILMIYLYSCLEDWLKGKAMKLRLF